ncbi:tripartite tricarboxylate transporter substrate binding protein [Cupriavidus sp. TKC]|uniref:Bug family tripartite tricarboxylate transporter substrate binding protein n=1 Tax=Cupriavidus sp. TKC TaxID=2880159 RepID=UPI00295F293C|nr:tripartite tricarboxylate transporter substrate binding protein [Cupriavidus sp. TKC]
MDASLVRARPRRLRPSCPSCRWRALLPTALSIATVCLAAVTPVPGHAASDYPNRPIKLVLGFPPGGSTDVGARRVADQLGKRLGQPVVVENRPGASGNIAAAYVAKTPPDGYTLFYGTNTTHAMNVSLYPKLGYDPVKDFVPIVLMGKVWNVLSVNPSYKATSLAELIAMAKAAPGQIDVATPGNSTSPHMSLVLLESRAGIKVTHVPYKGSAAALNDVMGGQTSVLFDNLPASLPYIKAGKLRALAVSSPQRLSILPDVPTFNELGIKGYEVAGWGALWAPAGTPQAIVDRLNREANAVLKDPTMIAQMEALASDTQGGTAKSLAAFAAAETQRWGEVIRSAGLKLD